MSHGACHHCGCAFEECECTISTGISATGRTIRMAASGSAKRGPIDKLATPILDVDYSALERRVLAELFDPDADEALMPWPDNFADTDGDE